MPDIGDRGDRHIGRKTPHQIYYEAFHDGNHLWQEPWAVIDASTDNLLILWYPDRDEQCPRSVSDDIYEQYAYQNFDARIRYASEMPPWARFE